MSQRSLRLLDLALHADEITIPVVPENMVTIEAGESQNNDTDSDTSIIPPSQSSHSTEFPSFSDNSLDDPNYSPVTSESSKSDVISTSEEKYNELLEQDLNLELKKFEKKKSELALQIHAVTESQELEDEVERAIKKNYTDRKDFCLFCEKDVAHFARHLYTWHSAELDVERIMSYNLKSKERRDALRQLKKRGNFLKNRTGTKIRPVKRVAATSRSTHDSFLPCKFCLGYYKKHSLYRHTKLCPENPDLGKIYKRQTSQSDGQTTLLLGSLYKHDQLLKTSLFPRMRADEISLLAKKDQLICNYAYSYLKGRRSKGNIDLVRQNMRRLAKLVKFARDTHGSEIKEMLDILRPHYFQTIIKAVNIMAKYNNELEKYESPSLAMNFGTLIKKCCDLAYIYFLQQKCDTSLHRKDLKILKQLIESQWANEVSTQAASNLNENRWNKDELLPLSADLKLLNDYLIKKALEVYEQLRTNENNWNAYNILKEVTYSQILLLNRRRPAEVAQLKVQTYRSIDLESHHENEFEKCLTETEKILLKTFSRLVIRGKRGRGVPILLSPTMKKQFELLIEKRNNFVTDNDFIFHTSGQNCIDGTKVLKKYASQCGARQAARITATRLRKHLATICQLLQFSDQDLEQLSTFMGHTLKTHCNVYRMSDNMYQTAKVSKLLILMADGRANEFKGKQLDDITIDLNPVYEKAGIFDEMLSSSYDSNASLTEKSIIPFTKEDSVSNNELKVQQNFEKTDVTESKTTELKQGALQKTQNKCIKRQRCSWSESQKKVLTRYFQEHIKNKRPPKKHECCTLQTLHPELFKDRNWTSLKAFIFNTYHRNENVD